jgi:hypothetical protein
VVQKRGNWWDVDTVFGGGNFTLSLRFITNDARMAAAFHDLRALRDSHGNEDVPLPPGAARPPPPAGGEPALPDVVFFSLGLWPLGWWVDHTLRGCEG